MDNKKAFLGTGWSFPPTFTKRVAESGVELVSDVEDIRQSLEILLSTQLGERILQPEFGSNLNVLLFENLDLSLITLVEDIIETSILSFESRIDVQNINVDTSQQTEGILTISVDFIVTSINTRTNIVFPFFINEGTNIV